MWNQVLHSKKKYFVWPQIKRLYCFVHFLRSNQLFGVYVLPAWNEQKILPDHRLVDLLPEEDPPQVEVMKTTDGSHIDTSAPHGWNTKKHVGLRSSYALKMTKKTTNFYFSGIMWEKFVNVNKTTINKDFWLFSESVNEVEDGKY